MTEPSHSPAQVPCVWFFIPLPAPAPLPAGFTYETERPISQLVRTTRPTSPLLVSLLVHHVPRPSTIIASQSLLYQFALQAVAGDNFEPVQAVTDLPKEDALAEVVTVIEAAVPLDEPGGPAQIEEALDAAIEAIRRVQLGIAAVTEKGERMLARATLPPVLPTFCGYLTFGGIRPDFEDPIVFEIAGSAPAAAFGLVPEPFTTDQVAKFKRAMYQLGPGAGFSSYVDLRREALTQRELDGNTRMAALALAAAGEVFLDTVLLHLLWEERTEPVAAAAVFTPSRTHARRIALEVTPRLQGNWNTNDSGRFAAYINDVVRLRHRVIHSGHVPTAGELDKAWTAAIGLEQFIGDRLAHASVLPRFPRSAVAWAGKDGLQRRNAWTRRVRALAESEDEPDWVATFARWRLQVDRALDPSPVVPGQSANELVVYVDVPADGERQWTIYDGESQFAAVVADPEAVVSSDVISQVQATFDGENHATGESSVVISLAPREDLDPTALSWQRADLVFDDLPIFPRA